MVVTLAGVTSDRLYPLYLQQEMAELLPGRPDVTVVHSMNGHDSFLIETDQVAEILGEVLEALPTTESPAACLTGSE